MTFIVSDRTALPLGDEAKRRFGVSSPAKRFGPNSRVMHLCRVGYIGGAEKILLTLASMAVAEGREVFLACPSGPLSDEARRHGIKVLDVAFSRMQISGNPFNYIKYGLNRIAGVYRILELCREYGINILHAHHPVTAMYCDHAVRRDNISLILHVHEGPPGRMLYYMALRRAANLASRIICVSNAGMDLLISAGVKLDKAQVVHNGVQLPKTPDERKVELRRSSRLRIAVIGMIEPRKGQDIFIEAIAMIVSTGLDLECHIIGDVPTNGLCRYKQKLIERVSKLGLQDNVKFVPYIPNVIESMDTFDIIVSSSTGKESLGYVVLEAMTQGCTVVATKVGGIEDVVKHGINGFLAEPGCPHSLKESIQEAMLSDRQSVGREAKAIRQHFSPEAMCAAVTDVYRSQESFCADLPG